MGNSPAMWVDPTGEWVWPWDPNAKWWFGLDNPFTPSAPDDSDCAGLPFFGKPDSSDHIDGPDGQIRDYNEHGIPKTDYDFGHPEHHPSLDSPHAHDWEVVDGEWVRGPARDVEPNEGPPVAQYVAVGAAGVGVGYLLYRGVRMIPSLFPAAWPTIPLNLAVP